MCSEGGSRAGYPLALHECLCTANHMVSVPGHRQWMLPCCFTF